MTAAEHLKALQLVALIAGMICVEVPARKNKWATKAKVDWQLIQRLEAALVAAGYDIPGSRAVLATLPKAGA